MNPRIVFCTTCKGRTQHLQETLPQNLADNRSYGNAHFVVLDYGSQDHLLAYLKAEHAADIKSGRLAVYSYPSAGAFKMAHAKNMAHRCGILEGADILVNLDADNFTGRDFAHYIAKQFSAGGHHAFLWAKMIPGVLCRGISGRIVVTRHAFLNAGGYDEQYDDWGPDDKDFNLRLRRLGYQAVEIDPCHLSAVRHNNKLRFREYPHAQDTANEDQFENVNESDSTITNFGNFGCGIVYKNFDLFNQVFDPIDLNTLPTRVFGIGMHKTATTSLHTALKMLGVESAHWQNAHWAKAIWQEMTSAGRSLTVEQHYALCDLPITLLFRELDLAYPGSKFILTTKDEGSWLESVRNHWDYDYNRYRVSWDTDPFTHRLHKLLYGQKQFDADIFLERFRRHNAEVREYFKDRPRDLLVMDMDAGAGWAGLCELLRLPVPAFPYPHIDPVARGSNDPTTSQAQIEAHSQKRHLPS